MRAPARQTHPTKRGMSTNPPRVLHPFLTLSRPRLLCPDFFTRGFHSSALSSVERTLIAFFLEKMAAINTTSYIQSRLGCQHLFTRAISICSLIHLSSDPLDNGSVKVGFHFVGATVTNASSWSSNHLPSNRFWSYGVNDRGLATIVSPLN